MASTNFWGELIIQVRTAQKLSQRQLAAKSGVNRSTLRRIEREGGGDITIIETVLLFLGYELEALPLDTIVNIRKKRLEAEKDPVLRSRLSADIVGMFNFPR